MMKVQPRPINQHDRCPCGSGQTFQACCQPFVIGAALPATPEQLMRSRYSAFCIGAVDYLIATHHPSQRRASDRQTLAQTITATEWLGLRVLAADPVAEGAQTGSVEFVAYYREHGAPGQLHEKSEFVRQGERWYYLRGELLPPITPGRNAPCWCGSGRKYRQCHGVG